MKTPEQWFEIYNASMADTGKEGGGKTPLEWIKDIQDNAVLYGMRLGMARAANLAYDPDKVSRPTEYTQGLRDAAQAIRMEMMDKLPST